MNENMERIENPFNVVKRVCGLITPVGITEVDSVRFDNLKDTIDITEKLINDIIMVAAYKGHYECSRNKAGELASQFITNLVFKLCDKE